MRAACMHMGPPGYACVRARCMPFLPLQVHLLHVIPRTAFTTTYSVPGELRHLWPTGKTPVCLLCGCMHHVRVPTHTYTPYVYADCLQRLRHVMQLRIHTRQALHATCTCTCTCVVAPCCIPHIQGHATIRLLQHVQAIVVAHARSAGLQPWH